jgi:hypothetical protein
MTCMANVRKDERCGGSVFIPEIVLSALSLCLWPTSSPPRLAWRPMLIFIPVHAGFMADGVAEGQIFLLVLRPSPRPLSIISQFLHADSFACHERCITSRQLTSPLTDKHNSVFCFTFLMGNANVVDWLELSANKCIQCAVQKYKD